MNLAKLLGSVLLLLTGCPACGERQQRDAVEVTAPTPARPAKESRSLKYWWGSSRQDAVYLIAEHPDGAIWVEQSYMEGGIARLHYWRGRPIKGNLLSVTRSDGFGATWEWVGDSEPRALRVQETSLPIELRPLTDPVYKSTFRAENFEFR